MIPVKFLISFSALCFELSYTKVIPIIYEDFEMCVDDPAEVAGKLDFSELEVFAESDTKVYLNGSMNFLKEVKKPWSWVVFTERFSRNQWNVDSFYRKIPDFCKSILNPLEPWYFITSKMTPNNCPFLAGVSIYLK